MHLPELARAMETSVYTPRPLNRGQHSTRSELPRLQFSQCPPGDRCPHPGCTFRHRSNATQQKKFSQRKERLPSSRLQLFTPAQHRCFEQSTGRKLPRNANPKDKPASIQHFSLLLLQLHYGLEISRLACSVMHIEPKSGLI